MGLKLEVGKYYRGVDGNKYGPMECVRSTEHPWNEAGSVSCHVWRCDGTSKWQGDPTLIAEWTAEDAPTSPVRTVTRKEIVKGVYDGLEVGGSANGMVFLAMPIANFGQESIDALIANLTAIRDALEENQ